MTRFRRGDPDDLPALRAIQAAALAEPCPALLAAAEGPPALYVLAGDEVIGYAIAVVGDDRAYLPEVAIRPDRQGQGHGSWLMGRLLAHLAGRGCSAVRVTVRADDERARSFYAEHGFAVVDRVPDQFRSGDGLVLAHSL